jgi:predicted membrane protein
MAGEEKKREVGKEDLEKKNCPLSPTDWILFLSGEIYNEENTNNQDSHIPTVTLLVVVALSIIALIFAVGTTEFPANTINNILFVLLLALSIFIILIFIYLGILLSQVLARLLIPSKTRKRVQALKRLREKIIFGEEKDCIKIREKWDEIYRTMYPKKRIRYDKKN